MNILMISHFVPYPPTNGALQRNYNLLREISKYHEVFLVTLTQKALLPDERSLKDAVDRISPFCKTIKVFRIPSDAHQLRWYALLLLNLFSFLPYSVKRFASHEMKNEIIRILKTEKIDIIHVDTIDLAGYVVGNAGNVPKVLNHHNVESALLVRRAIHTPNPFSKSYLYLQAWKLKHYEQKMIPLFDANIAVSPLDRISIATMAAGKNVSLVPNGTDTDYFTPSTSPQECLLIFAGSLNWLPNADAMMYFCSDIFPLIQAKVPNVRLKIIGVNPPTELQRIVSNCPNIELLGFVPDIRGYFAKASVHVVPLRIGGGTRLKILDALAMGKAVVSTSIGAEGLDLADGVNIFIADTKDVFARKVICLLRDSKLRQDLGRKGRSTVEMKFSWKVIAPELLSTYSSVYSNK